MFALANGASGVDARRDATGRSWSKRCARSCEPLAIGIVRGGEGATKLITITRDGRRIATPTPDGGAGDRQLAAGQDRDPRRRSELGPSRRRRRPRPASRSSSTARAVRIGAVDAVRGRPPYDERAPQAAEYLHGQGDRRRGRPRHRRRRRARTMWTCDLQRGVRARSTPSIERRSSDADAGRIEMNRAHSRCRCAPAIPSRFLSILDFEPDAVDQAAALAPPSSRRARAGTAAPRQPLEGQHVALLFEKPSLRTRSTFKIAVRELGGDVDRAAGRRRAWRPRVDQRRRPQSRALGVPSRWSARSRRRGSTQFADAAPRLRVDQRAHRRRTSLPGARGHA